MRAAFFSQLASATPSMCTWHHCTPYGPEPKWSVNPPNVPPHSARVRGWCFRAQAQLVAGAGDSSLCAK